MEEEEKEEQKKRKKQQQNEEISWQKFSTGNNLYKFKDFSDTELGILKDLGKGEVKERALTSSRKKHVTFKL